MKLVVMIPALNEEATVGDLIRGIPRSIPGISQIEVVVINDGSTDRTAAVARAAGARVVDMETRSGLGFVFRAGLAQAMSRRADVIINIDGDGQFDPADIPRLVEPVVDGRADFVTCTRFGDPACRPRMPRIKYLGNLAVTRIINWLCGDTGFTDVSCGFRAFNREAAYRLTLFGRFTYTQEMFIDLVSKGLRIQEIPLQVRGTREHGESRIASSVLRYGCRSLAIMLRAVRDIQPLKFFGVIGAAVFLLGLATGGFVTGWWWFHGKTAPFTSLIPISGALVTLAFLLGVLALLADMVGRHRKITEELLYLARRRVFRAGQEEEEILPRRAAPHGVDRGVEPVSELLEPVPNVPEGPERN